MSKNFQVGQWVFCEFKLQQIKNMEDGRVTEVTDGILTHSSRDLTDRCFSLSIRIKRISDEVAHYMDKFHTIKVPGLNFPDLSREMVSRWVDMCETTNDADLRIMYDSLSAFSKDIHKKINGLQNEQVGSFKLFR